MLHRFAAKMCCFFNQKQIQLDFNTCNSAKFVSKEKTNLKKR